MVTLKSYLVGPEGEYGYGGAPDTSAPAGLIADPAAGAVDLRWLAPTSGAAVTDYSVQYKAATSGVWLTFAHAVSTATTKTVTGLTNGTTYDFRVAAIRAGVTGTYTAPVQAKPSALVLGSTFYGINTNADTGRTVAQRQGLFGGRIGVVRRYYSGALPAQFEQTTAVCPEKLLSISFKPGDGFSAADIASGAFNTRFRQWLESIPAGWRVWVTYWHEVNDDINAGNITGAQFTGAYAQLYPVLQEAQLQPGVTVRLCANFMAFQITLNPNSATWQDSWVPPPGTMDLLTIDLYGNPGQNTRQITGPAYGTSYPDPATRSAIIDDLIRRTGWSQHWGILEVNAPGRDWDADESDRIAWHHGILAHWQQSQATPPEIVLLWENPIASFAKWDQSYGRVPGDPSIMGDELTQYIASTPAAA